MDTKQLVLLALKLAILGTVFQFGLRATLADLLYLVQRPRILVRSLLAVLVIMPVFAVLLVQIFNLRTAIAATLISLAISPVPPLLPRKQGKAGGLHAYGLGLMVTLALAAIPLAPLQIAILQWVFDRRFEVGSSAIAQIVLTMVVLPIVAGMLVHAWLPVVAVRCQRALGAIANALLVLAVLALLAGTWKSIWLAVGGGAVASIALFVATGLLVGHLLGGPERENSAVLALSTACRHPAIALSIAAANFPDDQFVGTILLYLIVNAVICIPYVAWQRRKRDAVTP